jgi:SAM-dependent methyltransferase
MPAVPNDYDLDPQRWASRDLSTQVFGDVYESVAHHITELALEPVLDIGGGDGDLGRCLPPGWNTVLIDASPTQLRRAPGIRVHADARRLPIGDNSVGAAAMLWMLYHLDDPIAAITEARRVLRPGGLFVASTQSRRNDPELTEGYPPSTFDAEEAPTLVSAAFANCWVESWDAPMTYLADEAAVLRYCRSHSLATESASRALPPLWLTKRGCIVYARKT